jgi:hypothetical protein
VENKNLLEEPVTLRLLNKFRILWNQNVHFHIHWSESAITGMAVDMRISC